MTVTVTTEGFSKNRYYFDKRLNTPNITILEGICGVGKTTKMIEYIKNHQEERYLIVLPLLDEIDRYQKELPKLDFKEPDNSDTSKTEHLKRLLKDKSNILCTHSLFKHWDTGIKNHIMDAGYHIIIDEETQVLEKVDIKAKVIENVIKLGYMNVDPDTNLVLWDSEKSGHDYDGEKEHQTIIRKAKSGSLYCFDGVFFVWELPRDLFKIGKKYTIMTYLFKGNFMEAYFNSHDIEYTIEQIDPIQAMQIKSRARDLIEFVPMTVNMKSTLSNSKRGRPLSKTFIQKQMSPQERKSFCNAIRNIVYKQKTHNIDRVMITCFQDFMKSENNKKRKIDMMPRSMDDCFVRMNARGSNEWGNRDFVIHMADLYPEPHLDKYLTKRSNGSFNRDTYALSMLVQFVYRSAIRNNKRIKLMICSDRMLKLFQEWLTKPE